MDVCWIHVPSVYMWCVNWCNYFWGNIMYFRDVWSNSLVGRNNLRVFYGVRVLEFLKRTHFFPFHWKWCTSIMTSTNRCLWSMQYHKLGHERIIDSMLISTVIFHKGLGPILGPWEAIKCHLTRNLHRSNNCNLALVEDFTPNFRRFCLWILTLFYFRRLNFLTLFTQLFTLFVPYDCSIKNIKQYCLDF